MTTMATAFYISCFPHTTTFKFQFSTLSSSIFSDTPPHFTFNTKNWRNLALKSSNSFSISAVSTPIAETSQSTSSSNSNPSKTLPFRVGHGFDLHRLEPGYPLIIGGINIPHDRGCEAHSDGDVLLHCVVDAILGALGLPDIGQIFPDNDPKWKGAASSVFIKEAVSNLFAAPPAEILLVDICANEVRAFEYHGYGTGRVSFSHERLVLCYV